MIYKDSRASARRNVVAKEPQAPTKQAVIYCRISLDAAGEGLGVKRQEKECRDWAARHGWQVTDVLVDNDISATTGKRRPAFERLLEEGHRDVIVWHTDRLVRVTPDLERVINSDLYVHAVVAGELDLSTPSGKAVARTIVAWATYEGEQKALRQKAAHRQRAEAGRTFWSHRRPFGWNGDGSTNQPEHDALKRCFEIKRQGGTYAQCAEFLREQGFTTTLGKRWNGSNLSRVMRSPRVAGLASYGDEIVGHGTFEPVVSEDEWVAVIGGTDKVSHGNALRPRRTSGTDKRVKSMLGGLIFCPTHGDPFKQTYQGANRKTRVYQPPCHCVAVNADWLDAYIGNIVVRELASLANVLKDGEQPTQADATRAAARAVELREALEAFASMERFSALSPEQEKAREDMEQKLSKAERTARDFYSASPLDRVYNLSDLLRAWKSDGLSLQHRREAVAKVIERIEIRKRTNRREPANPSMVTVISRIGGTHLTGIDPSKRTMTHKKKERKA